MRRALLFAPLALLGACTFNFDFGGDPYADLGGEPCPDSVFTCITIEVPLDHDEPDSGETTEVTFAILPATGASEGALVVAVGGPGASGVSESDFRLPGYPPELLERYDLVFFDQRGIGTLPDPSCPSADEDWVVEWERLIEIREGYWEGMIGLTDDYVASCVAEMGDPALLAHMGTEQTAADLEMFREALGYERLVIYGESYGTILAQVYAAAYPDRVERLVLDGTLDPDRDAIQLAKDQIEAIESSLAATFAACDADPVCGEDMGRPAAEAYRALVDGLTAEPATVRFPVEPDVFEEFPVTAEDLGYLAYTTAYLDSDRTIFLRSLAAAVSRGDYVPLSRLYALGAAVGLSSAVNLGVLCLDQPLPGPDAPAEISNLTTAWEGAAAEHRWFYEFALTCAFWPHVDRERDGFGEHEVGPIPTLLVASDADPATPLRHAETVVGRSERAHLLVVNGGSHVMFGRGVECVDQAVTGFLLDGTFPAETTCQAEVILPYFPLLPEDPGAVDTIELLRMVDNELFYLPEAAVWDGTDGHQVGCTLGGALELEDSMSGPHFLLHRCQMTEGLILDGEGLWNFSKGSSRLEVSINGGSCLLYTQVWETGEDAVEEC